jgi:thioredoxin 1
MVKKMISEDTKLIHIHSEAHWAETLKSTKNLIVVDFYAVWCGPCKQVAPYFEQFAREIPNVLFVKVDVDQQPAIAQNQAVRAMPTFQFIKNGKVLDTLEGADLQGILKRIEKFSK